MFVPDLQHKFWEMIYQIFPAFVITHCCLTHIGKTIIFYSIVPNFIVIKMFIILLLSKNTVDFAFCREKLDDQNKISD